MTPYTLEQAKEWLIYNLDDGVRCPCCARYAKRYKRKLSARMARWLVQLTKLSGPEQNYVHAKNVFHGKRGSNADDYCYLHKFQLIEPAPSDANKDQAEGRKPGRNGMWRPTDTGVLFVYGRRSVPRHVVLYNGNVSGYSDEYVTIREALADKFDYDELMSS